MTIEILKDQSSQIDLFGYFTEEFDKYRQIYKDATFIRDKEKSKQKNLIEFIQKGKLTYGQDWISYNKAKTNEATLFKGLLQELLYLAINNKSNRGYSIKDKIFSMCIKIYYKRDLRTSESILKELKKLHYIEKVPCFKSIDNFFNDESLNRILDDLIFISSLPLAGLEVTGAIDSTGFSARRFENWNKYKWGKLKGRERIWRKAHVMVGCRSNIILSVKVTKSNIGDSIMFEEVVGNKPKFFAMKNVVADMAYNSRRIIDFICNMGLDPYIPFKKNATGRAKGSFYWMRLFKKFKENNNEYMRKYHTRSNIETSFHVIKTRLGNHLMTKNFNANSNEIKIKCLCTNLSILVHEMFESNICIDFEDCVNKVSMCNK